MKSFLLKCLLFFVVFFLLDKTLIFVRNAAPSRELDKRLEWILHGKLDATIIVFGSSRGARDVIASQIEDSVHQKSFNLSYPGSNIEFHDYLLEKLLQFNNKKPKLLILVVDDPAELSKDETIIFRYDRLYPLVNEEDVRNTLIARGEKNKILSTLFIAHQLTLGSFDFRKKKFKDQDTLLADGSMPISYQSPKFNKIFAETRAPYDRRAEEPTKTASFIHFLTVCKDNHIKLLLVTAPNFGNLTPGFTQRMSEFAKQYQDSLYVYDSKNLGYKNPDLYFDNGHLTVKGASMFTAEVSRYITNSHLVP